MRAGACMRLCVCVYMQVRACELLQLRTCIRIYYALNTNYNSSRDTYTNMHTHSLTHTHTHTHTSTQRQPYIHSFTYDTPLSFDLSRALSLARLLSHSLAR